MLRRSILLALVVTLMTAAFADAQERQRRRGGFGGFGFGRGGFGGGSIAFMLAMEEVQKELKINEDQKALLEDMSADLQDQMREQFSAFRNFRDLSDEERRKAGEEMRKKGEEIQKKATEMVEMILEPDQMDRAKQLQLQQMGVAALNRPDVQKKLGITDKQKKEMEDVREKNRVDFPRGGGFFNASQEEREEMMAKFRESREKTEKGIMAVLTDKQRKTLASMKGKEFKFPERRFGGFGGRGGRRRNR